VWVRIAQEFLGRDTGIYGERGLKTAISRIAYSASTMRRKLFFFFFFSAFFRATLVAYGGFQARGQIGPTAASLHHSCSHVGSKLHLRPTPQLMATPDP